MCTKLAAITSNRAVLHIGSLRAVRAWEFYRAGVALGDRGKAGASPGIWQVLVFFATSSATTCMHRKLLT